MDIIFAILTIIGVIFLGVGLAFLISLILMAVALKYIAEDDGWDK